MGAVLALAIPGCFSEILPQAPVSTLAFACAAIDPETESHLRIVTYVGDAIDLPVGEATDVLQANLLTISGREPDAINRATLRAPSEPRGVCGVRR
jgi:hypothetical protein